jgi:hypothetical protein
MRQRLAKNPMLIEVATYVAVVLVAAGLSFTHWAAPLLIDAASSTAARLVQ